MKRLSLIILALFIAVTLNASDTFSYLDFPSARASGLASITYPNSDSSAVFKQNASLGYLDSMSFSLSHNLLPFSRAIEAFTLATPLKVGVLGFGLILRNNFFDLEKAFVNGEEKNGLSLDTAFLFSYAMSVNDYISVALSVKYLASYIVLYSFQTLVFDVGFQTILPTLKDKVSSFEDGSLSINVNAKNVALTPSPKYTEEGEDIYRDTSFVVGLSQYSKQLESAFSFDIGYTLFSENPFRLNAGFEAFAYRNIRFRGGLSTDFDDVRLSIGSGFRINSPGILYSIEYAYAVDARAIQNLTFAGVHSFSININREEKSLKTNYFEYLPPGIPSSIQDEKGNYSATIYSFPSQAVGSFYTNSFKGVCEIVAKEGKYEYVFAKPSYRRRALMLGSSTPKAIAEVFTYKLKDGISFWSSLSDGIHIDRRIEMKSASSISEVVSLPFYTAEKTDIKFNISKKSGDGVWFVAIVSENKQVVIAADDYIYISGEKKSVRASGFNRLKIRIEDSRVFVKSGIYPLGEKKLDNSLIRIVFGCYSKEECAFEISSLKIENNP